MTKVGMAIACFAFMAFSVRVPAQPASTEAEDNARPTKLEPLGQPLPAASTAAEQLLRKRVESIDWTDKTFEEVLDWLREQGERRVNVVARWGPLGVESVNRESLVTLQLNSSTVAEVLNETVDQLSDNGEVRYHGIGNTLKISTRQDFERKYYVRVYDCTDILFRVPDFGEGAPQIDLQKTNRGGGGGGRGGGGGGGGGSGQGVFSGGSGGGREQSQGGEQAEQEIEERLIKLKELIEKSISAETWAPGGRGTIQLFNRSLVINNTIEVHEMIAGAFAFGE